MCPLCWLMFRIENETTSRYTRIAQVRFQFVFIELFYTHSLG